MAKYYSNISELWRDDAACKEIGVDIFFADTEHKSKQQINSTQIAKQICSKCKTQAVCLSYALNNEIEYGIWGGFTGRERKNIRTIFDLKLYSAPLMNTIVNKTISMIKIENKKNNS